MKKLTLFTVILITFSCQKDHQLQEQIADYDNQKDFLNQVYQQSFNQNRIQPNPISKTNSKPIYVHYMVWYKNLLENGKWGQHWTMTNKNPDVFLKDGRREIASHFYPLIGPYSSTDKDLHEYHLLLMKLAGIDGIIFDWYGARDNNDFIEIKENTETFISSIEEVGLNFAIMYEDHVAEHAINERISASQLAAAVYDINYIKNTYFTSKNYARKNNKEYLFLFGPHFITNPKDWDDILSQTQINPELFTLWKAKDRIGQNADGEFSWIDPLHLPNLEYYYNYTIENNIPIIGSVYPGFDDYMAEGGWNHLVNNQWVIPHNGIQTFKSTLNLSNNYNADFLQVHSWNNFEEGTMIEPTIEFGYTFLEELQSYSGVKATKEHLLLPEKLYHLRKRFKKHRIIQRLLDVVYRDIITLRFKNADKILRAIEKVYHVTEHIENQNSRPN